MKRIYLTLSFIASFSISNIAAAQNIAVIKPVFDACVAMQNAIKSGSTENLRAANKTLKAQQTQDFKGLRLSSGKEISLNNHFIFDEEFVDSLIVNRSVYKFAQRYADKSRTRGSGSKGKVYTRTMAIKKNSTVKYTFTSRGSQELGIVTEPGGAISIKVYDKKNQKMLYRDTKSINKGLPYRSCAFNLPQGKICLIELEISNRSNKDISFVVIGN